MSGDGNTGTAATNKGHLPLHVATQKGHEECVKLLRELNPSTADLEGHGDVMANRLDPGNSTDSIYQ